MGIVFFNEPKFWECIKYFVEKGVVQKKKYGWMKWIFQRNGTIIAFLVNNKKKMNIFKLFELTWKTKFFLLKYSMNCCFFTRMQLINAQTDQLWRINPWCWVNLKLYLIFSMIKWNAKKFKFNSFLADSIIFQIWVGF